MKKKRVLLPGDKPLWVVLFLLSIISLVSVYTTVGLVAASKDGTTPTDEFLKHLFFVVLTYALAIVVPRVNYRLFQKSSSVLYVLALGSLVYVIVTHGLRWANFWGVRFQPSEFAKVLVIMYMASVVVKYRDKIINNKALMMLYIVPALPCFLILGANLSTAVLLFLTCFIMVFFGGVNDRLWLKHLSVLLVVGVLGIILLIHFGADADVARSATWGHRFQTWLSHDYDQLTQENMARMAIARGGLTGAGIGSTIHGRLMTESHNDFIFAIILEEGGLLWGIVVFLLYAIFFYRCISIASCCSGAYGGLVVAGLGTLIFLQAMVNMSVAVGLMPVTGQTLPFISYGGSAYLFLGFGFMVIQSVAHDNNKKQLAAQAEEDAHQSQDVVQEINKEQVVK